MKTINILALILIHYSTISYASEENKCPNKSIEMQIDIPQESNVSSEYFYELLDLSLKNINCNFVLKKAGMLPRTRAWNYLTPFGHF